MTHTYRDPGIPAGRGLLLGIAGMILILPVATVTLKLLTGYGFGWDDLRFYAPVYGLAILFAYLAYRQFAYGSCREISLGDEGTCEVATGRRLIRLHVNEIKSVKYRRDGEDESETYTLRYTGGKLLIRDRMENLPDFLARLTSLNPSVERIGFPADWPQRASAQESGDGLTVRSLAFPIVVAAILAWLALETLTGG